MKSDQRTFKKAQLHLRAVPIALPKQAARADADQRLLDVVDITVAGVLGRGRGS